MSHHIQTGQIEVISGCMFAGKTEELLRRLRRAEIAGQSIKVFTPAVDDRFDRETIGSHNGRDWEATVVETDSAGAAQVKSAKDFDIVAIDEFNFFSEGFIDVIEDLAYDGVRVIVSGTDQTFRAEPFEPMHTLLSLADEVDKLAAVCEQCGGRATRNQRLIDGEPAPINSPTVLVGGDESYEARCRHCHEVPSAETELQFSQD